MMMRSALYQTNTLAGFLQYQLTETTVCGYTCRSTLIHYPDSKPTSLCSFSLMQHTQRRSNKYQFCSLWFDPIRTRTHDLPHSRQARKPLHHQCGYRGHDICKQNVNQHQCRCTYSAQFPVDIYIYSVYMEMSVFTYFCCLVFLKSLTCNQVVGSRYLLFHKLIYRQEHYAVGITQK